MVHLSEEEFLCQTHQLIENKVANIFEENNFFTSAQNRLKDISFYTIFAGKSKRVRPLLCFAYQNFFNVKNKNKILSIAAAAELIHCASLLHDDVVDFADVRRGNPSVNFLYGNSIAVLTGNFLLTEAFNLLVSYDKEIINEAIGVIKKMSIACMHEISLRKSIKVSIDDWKGIALGKTAELFSWCGYSIAKLYGTPVDVVNLTELSKHIGYIFQMMDDLKDFNGDQFLKDECSDLKNQEASLPIILASQANVKNYEILSEAFNKKELSTEEIRALKKLIIDSGAVKETKKIVQEHLTRIKEILNNYSDNMGYNQIHSWLKELVCIELC